MIFTLLAALTLSQESPPKPELVLEALEELAEVGVAIEGDELFVETKATAWVAGDFDSQQSLFFEDGHFEALWVLYRAMGLGVESPVVFRRQVAAALAQGLAAYYSIDRKGIFLIEKTTVGVADLRHVLLHELVHAWQDQQRDLEEVYSAPESFERFRALQCLVEGEAEALAYRVELARRGVDISEFEFEEIDYTLTRLTAGAGVTAMYSAGLDHCLRHVRTHGWDGLPGIYDDPLPSTEELLHPSKLGRDRPLELTVPDWPEAWGDAELVHEDTLGEMGLFGILNDGQLSSTNENRPASESEIWRAVIGWDGDRYRYWRRGEDGHAFAWRVVFDRELDAEQFAALWERMSVGRTLHEGRAVAWAMAEGRADELARLVLDHAPVPAATPADAISTKALEDEWPPVEPSADPYVEAGRWHLPALGFSLPLPTPEGWQTSLAQGKPFLFAGVHDGFRENINVTTLPRDPQKDIEALLAENEAFFESAPSYRLHASGLREVDGVQAVYLAYGANVSQLDLEFRALLLAREDQQVVITATFLEARSKESASLLEQSLLGLRF